MNDLISRQAAIDAIFHNKEVYSNNFGSDPIDRYTIAIIVNDAQTIAQLPSTHPEPKVGRWRHYEGYLTCSECGTEYDDDIMTHCCDDVPRFCPNCGAEMKGEENE